MDGSKNMLPKPRVFSINERISKEEVSSSNQEVNMMMKIGLVYTHYI